MTPGHGAGPAPGGGAGAGPRRAGRGPAGPAAAISLCAGQGRDLIGALAGHPRQARRPRPAGRTRPAQRRPRPAGSAGGWPARSRGGDRRRGADRRLRRDDARRPGPGLRRVRQHDQRGRRAHGGLLHSAVRPGRHGGLDSRPLAPGPAAADLRLVRRPRLRPAVGVRPGRGLGRRRPPLHRHAGPAGGGGPHVHLPRPSPTYRSPSGSFFICRTKRGTCPPSVSRRPACAPTGSPTLTGGPVRAVLSVAPVTDRRAPGSVLSPPPEPGWRHRVWP